MSRDPSAAAPSSTLLPPAVTAAGAGAADLGTAATRSPTARRLAVGELKTPTASPLVPEGPVRLAPQLPWEHTATHRGKPVLLKIKPPALPKQAATAGAAAAAGAQPAEPPSRPASTASTVSLPATRAHAGAPPASPSKSTSAAPPDTNVSASPCPTTRSQTRDSPTKSPKNGAATPDASATQPQ